MMKIIYAFLLIAVVAFMGSGIMAEPLAEAIAADKPGQAKEIGIFDRITELINWLVNH
uniref:Myrmicitoxin(1)-Pm7a n=1 Tax=Pogonomyrmex maricopa TaxID=144040 RepID=TX7A_POGMA|nr:MYRTX1-Pm7a protein [Pogonomyrmex maricopa]WMI02505.1 MYRTX1-Pm7b protein [Pogonomyrmex maricopa]